MAQIVFHMKPHVDVNIMEVEYEMNSMDLPDLVRNLTSRNVDRVEFNTEED